MSEDVSQLKEKIIENFASMIGDAWEELTDVDKELLEELAKDAAKLNFRKMVSPDENLEGELRIVNASLLNLSVAKYLPVVKTFWRAVERAVAMVLSMLIKAALSAI